MKTLKTVFAILLLSTGLLSCKKEYREPDRRTLARTYWEGTMGDGGSLAMRFSTEVAHAYYNLSSTTIDTATATPRSAFYAVRNDSLIFNNFNLFGRDLILKGLISSDFTTIQGEYYFIYTNGTRSDPARFTLIKR